MLAGHDDLSNAFDGFTSLPVISFIMRVIGLLTRAKVMNYILKTTRTTVTRCF